MSRCVFFLWAVGLLAQQDDLSNPRTSAADVAQGERTFRSHCSPCHGLKGEGGRGPNLAAGIFYHGASDADLLRNISNGIDGTEMPALFYSPDRVWQVIAYIRSLNAGSHLFPAATVAAGEALFKRERCVECHRVNGVGGRLGPDLSSIGKTRSVEHLRQSILEPNADVRQRYYVVSITEAGGKTLEGFRMNEDTYTIQFIDASGQLYSVEKTSLKSFKIDRVSKMPSYQGKMSDDEVNGLVAYLSSLRPSGGAQ
jgi:putative heme-binding domain-containing protein